MSGSFLPFAWTPSSARSIALFDYASGGASGRLPTPLPLRWPDKPALSVLDYTLDATGLLGSVTDTISAYAVDVGALALTASVVIVGRLTLWLGGGVTGMDYPINITLTTASTRSVNRVVRLGVV